MEKQINKHSQNEMMQEMLIIKFTLRLGFLALQSLLNLED